MIRSANKKTWLWDNLKFGSWGGSHTVAETVAQGERVILRERGCHGSDARKRDMCHMWDNIIPKRNVRGGLTAHQMLCQASSHLFFSRNVCGQYNQRPHQAQPLLMFALAPWTLDPCNKRFKWSLMDLEPFTTPQRLKIPWVSWVAVKVTWSQYISQGGKNICHFYFLWCVLSYYFLVFSLNRKGV